MRRPLDPSWPVLMAPIDTGLRRRKADLMAHDDEPPPLARQEHELELLRQLMSSLQRHAAAWDVPAGGEVQVDLRHAVAGWPTRYRH